MHDNPRATEEEQELARSGRRHDEEESMRGAGFEDPEAERDHARGDADEEE